MEAAEERIVMCEGGSFVSKKMALLRSNKMGYRFQFHISPFISN